MYVSAALFWLCSVSPLLGSATARLEVRQSSSLDAAKYLEYQGTPAPFKLVSSPPKKAPVIAVANGSYYGYTNTQYGQDYFFGIPYAQPVIGQNRFKQPQTLNSTWEGYRNATDLGPACPTASTSNKKVWTMEDCLTLNVYRPAGAQKGAKLPIMIWFYGGGGIDGYSGSANFTSLVQYSASVGKPFIGVTFNNRMLNWGFLASNELAMDGSLNLFLHDQRKLMHWVHENARAFGGNPSRITIAGISFGGISVGWQRLYANGKTGGHFSRAMQMSGSASAQMIRKQADGQAIFDELISKTGCDQSSQVLTCLRSKTFAEIASVFGSSKLTLSGAIYYDDDYFPRFPHDSLTRGLYTRAPTIIGDVRDEGTEFVGTPAPDTEQGLFDLLYSTNYFPGPKLSNRTITELLEAYPDDSSHNAPFNGLDYTIPGYGAQWRRMASISGDVGLGRARIYDARQYVKTVPTWSYRHETYPWNQGNRSLDRTMGVSHGSDGDFVFLNRTSLGDARYVSLAEKMALHTLNFLYTGDPNAGGRGSKAAPYWPRYDPKKATLLARNATASVPMKLVLDDAREEALDFLNSVLSELSV